jgi:hypothetical protein
MTVARIESYKEASCVRQNYENKTGAFIVFTFFSNLMVGAQYLIVINCASNRHQLLEILKIIIDFRLFF